MKKSVTAKDVAQHCGVSQATVSYVVNGNKHQKVSQTTVQKVNAAIQALNYHPNSAARAMRNDRSTTVGIVCAKDYSHQAFLTILEGIGTYLQTTDYTITIYYEDDTQNPPKYVESYFSRVINGLIYISNTSPSQLIQFATQYNIPYVVLTADGVFNHTTPAEHGFSTALAECADYCKRHQLREIRYFSIKHCGYFVNHKFHEFEEILQKHYPEANLQHIVFHTQNRDAFDCAPFFYDYAKETNFDMAISQNYDIALPIQRAFSERNSNISLQPRHLILNYNNFYRMCFPSMSGIYIPYHEMSIYAIKLILAIIAGETASFDYQGFHSHIIYHQTMEKNES